MSDHTDLLDALVAVGGRDVADVGCGDGWLVRRLAARGARVVGIDPAPAALAAARAAPAVAGERYAPGSAEALPVPDAACDAVIFFNSLHHVPVERIDDAIGEAVRVCRAGGVVFVQEPLAEGPFFELMRPVTDETEVRAAAQDALVRAPQRWAVTITQRTFTPIVRVSSFEAWRGHQLLVDPDRAESLRRRERELRERFDALGGPAGDGRAFGAPARVTLLRPADASVGEA